jgi:hypothetical protein
MPSEIILIAILALATATGFFIGWWLCENKQTQDFKSIRQAIEESNKFYKEWAASPSGLEWEKGFQAGIKIYLDTMESLLAKAKKHDSP